MQPDSAWVRPTEKPGQESKPFAKVGPVAAFCQNSRYYVENNQREEY
jgi:hypothetical protein